MRKGKFSRLIFLLSFLAMWMVATPSRAEISVTLISFKEHPRGIEAQKNSLGIIFPPEIKIRYLDWKNLPARQMLSEIEGEAVPQVIYEQGIEEEKVFLQLVRNGVIEKKGKRYVLPEKALMDILGRVKLFFKRKCKPNRLDLFVMSACPFGVAAERRLINYLKREELADINLRLHYLVQFDEKNNPLSVRGEKELEENIRQVYIQKFHPEFFQDYLLSINKENFLDYEGRLKSFNIDKKAIADFRQEAIESVKEDMEFSAAVGAFSSPSVLWRNQYLIDSHIPFLESFPPFDQKKRWLKREKSQSRREKPSVLKLEYFYSLNCPPCFAVRSQILSDLESKYPRTLEIREYDAVNSDPGKVRLKELEEEFGFLGEAGVPAIYFQGNLLMGKTEIEKTLKDIIRQELGGPKIGVKKAWRRPEAAFLFSRIKSLFKSPVFVILFLLAVYLRQLNCPPIKFISLSGIFLGTRTLSNLYFGFDFPVVIRYIVISLLFSILFFLGVLKLYEFYGSKKVTSGLLEALRKKRSIVFLASLALLSGLAVSFLSPAKIYSLTGPETLAEFLFLALFSLVIYAFSHNKFFLNLLGRHCDLSRFLNACLFFGLSVYIWILK